MQKWLAATDAQWQAAFNRDVTDVHAAELKKLAQQYAADLDVAVTKASAAGDLDGAVALHNEKKRYADTNVFPERDDAADADSVKQIRSGIRAQLAKVEKVEKDAAARTKALHAKYDAYLADAQSRLTKAQRLGVALLVKRRARKSLRRGWPRLHPFHQRPVHARGHGAASRKDQRADCGAAAVRLSHASACRAAVVRQRGGKRNRARTFNACHGTLKRGTALPSERQL